MFKVIRHIAWFIKQEWKSYVLIFSLLLTITVFALVPGWLLGLSIDTIISGGLTFASLAWLAGSLAAFPVVRYGLSYAYNYTTVKKTQQLAHSMRKKYLAHLFEMDSSFPVSMKNTRKAILSRASPPIWTRSSRRRPDCWKGWFSTSASFSSPCR